MTSKDEITKGYAAAILAAGMGTRMKSSTPKALHRICGREMLHLVADAVRGAGVDDIAVVVPQDSRRFQDAIGDSVRYATQADPLGTGHAILQARTALKGAYNILVLYGDAPLIKPSTLDRLMQRHADMEACVTIITSQRPNPDGMGRILRDDSGGITAIVEEQHADSDTLAIREVNSGFYCFRAPWLWENLQKLAPAPNGELLLTDLIQAAAVQGQSVESITSDAPTRRWASIIASSLPKPKQ